MSELPLATALLAAARDDVPWLRQLAPAKVEGALDAALREGRAAWPDAQVDDHVFVRQVARGLGRGPARREDELVPRPTDLYLACACAQGDRHALAAFERRCLAAAPQYLSRFGDESVVSELVQELREKLFVGTPSLPPRIVEYAGEGSLEAWVRVIAMRLALDRARQVKRTPREVPVDEPTEALLDVSDPELAMIRARYKIDFAAAFRQALADLQPEERTVLRLYLVDRLNVAEIGAIIGVSRATAARRVADGRAAIVEATRERLSERLNISGSEAESMTRLLWSQLDVSLHSLLR